MENINKWSFTSENVVFFSDFISMKKSPRSDPYFETKHGHLAYFDKKL